MSERQSHGDPIEQGGHGMTLEVKKMPEQERPRYDLSTIVGIDVDNVKLPEEAEEMADAYLQELDKDKTNKASLAELAWAFRRQLQEDLRQVEADTSSAEEMSHKDKQGLTKRLRAKLLKTDESHAFSLALYRKLMERSGDTLQQELARHEQEKKEINGSYEVYKNLEKNLAERRGQLISLLSDMFHRAGQEPKPVHLAKRALLEAKVSELEDQLQAVKEKKPDVAALVEYDTIHSYAEQLRNNGFIWTKSRQELLQDVLTGALTSRPVAALMGETGTGKTAMARAASLELSSREPERTVGGDQEKFVRLLASPSIKAGETFYEYGPLLRALTGKSSSIDKDTSKGGGVFFDDEFNTRPTSVQRQILKFVSECRAGRQVAVPGTPLTVTVEPGFLYLAAGNPPSERYEREETGIETKREFAGNVLNVEYLEQTPDNPELYQILLATLLDSKTGRLTSVTPEEVEPGWVKDAATGEYHLNENERSGGFLYRFANCWSELNKAFSHQETVLTKLHPADQPNKRQLDSFILDPGVVISWLDQYKASPGDRKEHLAQFMAVKLDIYLKQFPEEEQKIVITYLEFFGLVPLPQSKDKISAKLLQKESGKPKAKVLTPKEIGYLNPNVPRPREKGAPPKFEAIDFLDPETGEVTLQYVAQEVLGQKPGAKFVRREVDARYPTTDIEVELLGWLFDEERDEVSTTEVVVKDREGKALVLSLRELRREYLPKREQQEGTSLERAKEILGEENV
ncbi:MAG: AAA family ATPase, partial [Patescibacteria group bacterium]